MEITGPVVLHRCFIPTSAYARGQGWVSGRVSCGTFCPVGLAVASGHPCFLPWQLFGACLSLSLGAFALAIPPSEMLELLAACQTPNHPSKPRGTKALSTLYFLWKNTPAQDCTECPLLVQPDCRVGLTYKSRVGLGTGVLQGESVIGSPVTQAASRCVPLPIRAQASQLLVCF